MGKKAKHKIDETVFHDNDETVSEAKPEIMTKPEAETVETKTLNPGYDNIPGKYRKFNQVKTKEGK